VHKYLEKIPRKALKDYHSLIKKYIKGRSGVYALYTGDRLKYVGLAVNLKNRLITHFHDRHAKNWDKFSIYLTSDHKHLRDLEALVLRIANPRENRNRTKFKGAENL